MRDWNNDGKIDGRDRAFEYMLYSSMSSDSKNEQSFSQDVSGCGTVLLALIIAVGFLLLVVALV